MKKNEHHYGNYRQNYNNIVKRYVNTQVYNRLNGQF